MRMSLTDLLQVKRFFFIRIIEWKSLTRVLGLGAEKKSRSVLLSGNLSPKEFFFDRKYGLDRNPM